MGIRVTEVAKTKANSSSDVSIFEDSSTLLRVQEHRLFISFDDGLNWEKSDELPVDIWWVEIDENYRNSRAVAMATNELSTYLTEDQGRHWRKLNLNLPKFTGGCDELDTHPFEKDYLLARCTSRCPWDYLDEAHKEYISDDESVCEEHSYVSNDGGKNFRKIEPPNTDYWDCSLTCEFACKSRNSVSSSNKDLVYCCCGQNFFYTDDFGKSFKFFDQFKDHTVSGFRILDSHVLVFTLEDKVKESPSTDLWVSNDGLTFNKASFPTVFRCSNMWRIIEDGLGRIIIPTCSYLREEQASPIFISDPSGLQFRFLDIGIKDTLVSSRLRSSKTLKGTMLADLTFKHPDGRGDRSHSKISLDYGETWSSLRVIRSPDQPKDLLPCDVDDVENSSLEPYLLFDVESSQTIGPAASPTAGILMTLGVVGKYLLPYDENMTFISRDGGRNWEVALEYPCRWTFGGGGNIIVAIPLPFKSRVPKDEFYYSLDQGKTWKKYHLEVPIESSQIISATPDGSDLNFIISGTSPDVHHEMTERFLYTIDFTGVFNGQECGSKDLEC